MSAKKFTTKQISLKKVPNKNCNKDIPHKISQKKVPIFFKNIYEKKFLKKKGRKKTITNMFKILSQHEGHHHGI